MLRELAAKAKTINIEQLVQQVVESNAGLIADNVREQLTKGIKGSGSAVGIYSSLWYSNMKQRIGSKAPSGWVDLKLSGSLFDEIFVKVSKTEVTVDSKVSYSKYQIERYGEKIYENTKENMEQVSEKNTIYAVRNYTKALGL